MEDNNTQPNKKQRTASSIEDSLRARISSIENRIKYDLEERIEAKKVTLHALRRAVLSNIQNEYNELGPALPPKAAFSNLIDSLVPVNKSYRENTMISDVHGNNSNPLLALETSAVILPRELGLIFLTTMKNISKQNIYSAQILATSTAMKVMTASNVQVMSCLSAVVPVVSPDTQVLVTCLATLPPTLFVSCFSINRRDGTTPSLECSENCSLFVSVLFKRNEDDLLPAHQHVGFLKNIRILNMEECEKWLHLLLTSTPDRVFSFRPHYISIPLSFNRLPPSSLSPDRQIQSKIIDEMKEIESDITALCLPLEYSISIYSGHIDFKLEYSQRCDADAIARNLLMYIRNGSRVSSIILNEREEDGQNTGYIIANTVFQVRSTVRTLYTQLQGRTAIKYCPCAEYSQVLLTEAARSLERELKVVAAIYRAITSERVEEYKRKRLGLLKNESGEHEPKVILGNKLAYPVPLRMARELFRRRELTDLRIADFLYYS